MLSNEEDNIKCLVKSIMVRLIGCDNALEDWWRNLQKTDKKIILEELEDTVYDWVCKDNIKKWIMKDEMWLP